MQRNILFLFLLLTSTLVFAQTDTAPPTPDPMSWALEPTVAGPASISMRATTAMDTSGVQYFFECTSGGGNSSGWQNSAFYTDTGLSTGIAYTYRVKARDTSMAMNETGYSLPVSATPENTLSGGFYSAWAAYDPNEFGDKTVIFDNTDVREIVAAPAIGVHPRLFFGPSEVADLRLRMDSTLSGQAVMKQIHAYTTLLHLGYGSGGTYSHSASYGQDAFGNRYIDNAGYWSSATYYAKLLAHDPTAFVGADIKRRFLLSAVMACEAYECLIRQGDFDPDTGLNYDDRAEDLATAMTYWAELVLGDPDLNPENYNFFGGEHMAICYDLNFNAMTTGQQDTVRMALAAINRAVPRYGGTLTPHATTSNWATLNNFEAIINFSIEGETGYNPELTTQFMRALRNFITYGWYDSGAGYEGMGKNYQFVGMLVVYAKRGYSLLGHPNVKAFGTHFLPSMMAPYGHAFTAYDAWGGSGNDQTTGGYKFNASDVLGLKWVFPNDPSVDFVWRNYIEKWYRLNSEGYVYQQISPGGSYHNYLLPAAMYALDYQTGPWEAQNETALNSKLSFFDGERGLSVMRSDFSTDAIALQHHCRQDVGGHTYGDRNSVTFSALGRIWTHYSYNSSLQETHFHNCILVNDIGIKITNKDGRKARQPGKVVAYSHSDTATFMAGDAAYAYTYEWDWQAKPPGSDHSWLGTSGWEAVPYTWNDFRYQPGTESYHSVSWYDADHWNVPGNLERNVHRVFNAVDRMFRTSGLVRGAHPFALIVDDVQKDTTLHNYKWLGQLPDDLEIDTILLNPDTANYQNDLILKEVGGSTTRRLLVRVLENKGATGGLPAYIDSVQYDTTSSTYYRRLVIESNSIAPDFKVLLFPFHTGDTLPVCKWDPSVDTLNITIGSQEHDIAFVPNPDGRTRVEILDENGVITLKEEVEEVAHYAIRPTLLKTGEVIWLEAQTKEGISGIVQLLDVNGRIVKTDHVETGISHVQIKTAGLSQGVFFVRLITEKGTWTEKVMLF